MYSTPPFRTCDSMLVGGSHLVHVGSSLLSMEESTEEWREGNIKECVDRLNKTGYLLLRGMLPVEHVRQARLALCTVLDRDFHLVDLSRGMKKMKDQREKEREGKIQEEEDKPSVSDEEALLCACIKERTLSPTPPPSAPSCLLSLPPPPQYFPGLLLSGYRTVTHDHRVMDILEGKEISTIFATIFGELAHMRNIRKEKPPTTSCHSSPFQTRNSSNTTSSPFPSISTASASPFSSLPPSCSSPPPPLVSPSTLDTKWVRVHGHNEFTDMHTDYYRFQAFARNNTNEHEENTANGSSNFLSLDPPARDMFTCWVPLGDYTPQQGTLVVAEGSHRLGCYTNDAAEAEHAEEEMKTELPHEFSAWLSSSCESSSSSSSASSSTPSHPVWRTAHFHPGDLVIFDLRLVHASTSNQSSQYRLSLDTRWMPTYQIRDEMKSAFREINCMEKDAAQCIQHAQTQF